LITYITFRVSLVCLVEYLCHLYAPNFRYLIQNSLSVAPLLNRTDPVPISRSVLPTSIAILSYLSLYLPRGRLYTRSYSSAFVDQSNTDSALPHLARARAGGREGVQQQEIVSSHTQSLSFPSFRAVTELEGHISSYTGANLFH
jgi:hypothetical protein